MRIYLAGPMAGQPGQGFAEFEKARIRLREAGYEVICPAEEATKRFTPEEREQFAAMGEAFRDTDTYKSIMRTDIDFVMGVDGVVTLTGWQHSRGANAEVAVAKCLGLKVGPIDHFLGEHAPTVLQWTGEDRWEPYREYPGDAGFDLYVAQRTFIPHDGFVDVSCGIRVELPDDMWAMITGRSSTLRKRGLLVTQGVIDNGFRGELYAGTQNLSSESVYLEAGERIAQLIPFHQASAGMELMRVETLSESDRGENGFGSTGT